MYKLQIRCFLAGMQKNPEKESWVEEEFGGVKLGDKRRKKRLIKVVKQSSCNPQGSIAQRGGDWSGAKGAYRFFDTDIEPEAISEWHEKRTRERMKGKEVVLAVQDTTVLNYSGLKAAVGLGSIGTRKSGNQGFHCHATLGVDLQGEILGVMQSQSYRRKEKMAKRQRGPASAESESGRWIRSLEACIQAALENPGTTVVSVGDRESDFYEYFQAALESAPGVEVLVRVKHDRELEGVRMSELLAAAPAAGTMSVEVPRREGRPARTAKLEVRFREVEMEAPTHWKKEFREGEPLRLWLVEACEKGDGEEKIRWRLLTSMPVESLDRAKEMVGWYVLRWKIEVFFHILKSGCKVEKHQLSDMARLERVLRVDLVVAWRVFHLMSKARAHPDHDAEVVLAREEWQALDCFLGGKRTPAKKPPKLGKILREIAKLGGFLGRKSDGNPGPTPVWIGLRRLDDITLSWLAFGR